MWFISSQLRNTFFQNVCQSLSTPPFLIIHDGIHLHQGIREKASALCRTPDMTWPWVEPVTSHEAVDISSWLKEGIMKYLYCMCPIFFLVLLLLLFLCCCGGLLLMLLYSPALSIFAYLCPLLSLPLSLSMCVSLSLPPPSSPLPQSPPPLNHLDISGVLRSKTLLYKLHC